MFIGGPDDAAAAAQQMPVLGEGDEPDAVTMEPELTLGELTQVWTLGVGFDRSLGRPKERNGESSGFYNFAFWFSNWLSGLPGDAQRFLGESANMGQPLMWATLAALAKIVARGALVGGTALSCIRRHPEKQNGFEMWRLLQRRSACSWSHWFLSWLDLVGECEQARGRMIDDDKKVAVMLKRSPKELRDHLVLGGTQSANVENKFPVM